MDSIKDYIIENYTSTISDGTINKYETASTVTNKYKITSNSDVYWVDDNTGPWALKDNEIGTNVYYKMPHMECDEDGRYYITLYDQKWFCNPPAGDAGLASPVGEIPEY